MAQVDTIEIAEGKNRVRKLLAVILDAADYPHKRRDNRTLGRICQPSDEEKMLTIKQGLCYK
jgi:hypothetical protein